jgi:hypothetical protein
LDDHLYALRGRTVWSPHVTEASRQDVSGCPGCGAVLPVREGPTHAYIGASPACWALFGEVLAREFGDPAYFRLHQLTVDTYAVQHPGVPEPHSIQSVAGHLITLCLVLERGGDPAAGPKLHRRLAQRHSFEWLEPPRPNGRITVADVLEARSPAEHERYVEAWARDVWAAWEPHHATVRDWIERALSDDRARS